MSKVSRPKNVTTQRLARELKTRQARNSLIDFIEHVYEGKDAYQTKWFHEVVCHYLDKLARGVIKKLMIFLPPQHGKSEMSSRMFPAYLLGRDPHAKVAVCSYEATMAQGFNRSIQQIIDNPKYMRVFPDTRLNSKNVSTDARNGVLRNSTTFEIVGRGGFLKAVGIGGPLTGTPVDIGIIDDPFKDRVDANSVASRERVWSWYQDVFQTRLHNDSVQLMLFTRWHEDDLAGRILDPNNKHYDPKEAAEWTVIALPALKEPVPPLPCAIDIRDPREVDEALWPEKHAAERYYRQREINPIGFASLSQQRPAPLEGGMYKREWFDIVGPDELPFDIRQKTVHAVIDGAYTDKTHNDQTAVLYYAKHEGHLYYLWCDAFHKEFHNFLDHYKNTAHLHGIDARSNTWIEIKATGDPARVMLAKPEYGAFNTRSIYNRLVALGKINRAESAAPSFASGKVHLLRGPWNQAFIEQHATFPNSTLKDMVDVSNYAVLIELVQEYSSGQTVYEH